MSRAPDSGNPWLQYLRARDERDRAERKLKRNLNNDKILDVVREEFPALRFPYASNRTYFLTIQRNYFYLKTFFIIKILYNLKMCVGKNIYIIKSSLITYKCNNCRAIC